MRISTSHHKDSTLFKQRIITSSLNLQAPLCKFRGVISLIDAFFSYLTLLFSMDMDTSGFVLSLLKEGGWSEAQHAACKLLCILRRASKTHDDASSWIPSSPTSSCAPQSPETSTCHLVVSGISE